MAHSTISCIIPVFNGERYLREALESIFQQTYQPLEIIVVDDGSTDDTANVVASYGKQVVYVRQANAGPGPARNLGLSVAHGEFLAFLDADDLWQPEKLELQMARFAARPELDLCLTYVQNFWIPELQKAAEKYRHHRFMQPVPGYTLQTALAKRTVFNTVGQFNPEFRLGEDTDWFLRVVEQQTVIEVLSEVLVYRRLHDTNITRVAMAQGQIWFPEILKASLDRRRRHQATPEPLNFTFSDQKQKT